MAPAKSPKKPLERPARSNPPSDQDTASCRVVLDRLLRETVISRLRLAHPETTPWSPAAGRTASARPASARPASARRASAREAAADRDDAEEDAGEYLVTNLAALLRAGQVDESAACAEAIMRDGGGLDAFFLDVAPRVATALHRAADGIDDDDDNTARRCDGEWRLNELIERLSPRFAASASAPFHGRRALLATPMPERHRLHLRITAECFTRDGWDAWCEPRGLADLVEMVRAEWFSMIVIASDQAYDDQLASMVRVLRRASCNRQLRVLVMNETLARRPGRLARLGVDAAATDVRHACTEAQRLLSMMPAAPPV